VQKSLLKMLGVVAVCSFSTTAYALGLGGINVSSALGQPLKADIELVAVNKDDKASLVARIASPEAYKGAGLEYPFGNKFKFQVESRANGEPYLKVTSSQPTSDPFVSLLVELSWSSGRLLREYTFLLDPPGYVAEQPAPVEVQAVAPAIQAVPAAAIKPVESQPAAKPAAEKPIERQAAVSVAKKVDATTEPRQVASGSITVKRGDTLSKIASENKSSDVSLERMLVALYSANADQFDGNNMNRIKTGKILRLPAESELAAVSQSSATKEIRAQAADWNTYRQKLASAASISTQSETGQQVSSGKISSSVADKTPVAKETAKEVLKLSKGEMPGDKASAGGTGKAASAQEQKNAAQEESIAKGKAAKEEQARIALLEKNLKDMQRLAELKSQALAELQTSAASSVASAVAAVSEVAAASAVEATSEVASASAVAAASAPAPVAKPAPVATVVEPTLVEQILAEPLYLAGAAVALLGGLALVMRRRKNVPAPKAASAADDFGSTTGRITAPVAPSPDTGDFTSTGDSLNHVDATEDDVNPLKEADLFLSFGRDAQAEEILKEALQNTPTNPLIHVKLLGIYANRKDVNSFAGVARQLFELDNDEATQQANAMGRKIDPTNPMYGGSASIEDADSATMQTSALQATPDFVLDEEPVVPVATPDLDFDLGASTESAASDFAEIASATMIIPPAEVVEEQAEVIPEVIEEQAGLMDFDITSTDSSQSAPAIMDFDVTSTSSSPAAPAVMDFDLTVTNPSLTAPTGTADSNADDLGDLVFDVTATHPSMPAVNPVVEQAVEPVAVAEEKLDQGMDFALDFPVSEPAAKAVVAPAAVDFGGIDLNLDGIGLTTPAAEEALPKDEHWHEVATKLDLAKAYQEMGDSTGAKEILDEVVLEGDEEQRQAAQALLDQLA